MRIIIIGTVASSFLSFRVDLIQALLAKSYTVYAFTSEYTEEELNKIEILGAIPITYELNRGGINPLIDIRATYELSKKINFFFFFFLFCYFSKQVIFGVFSADFV